MGLIARQGIKESLVNYVSVLTGLITTFFIFTYCLDLEQQGLIRFLQGTGALLLPFILLGVNSIIVRYFTYFRDKENQHNGFLFFVLLIPFIGFTLFLILSFVFKNEVLNYYANVNPLFGKYLHFLIPITFFMVYQSTLTAYSGVQFRIVIPSLVSAIGMKIIFPILVILYFFQLLNFTNLLIGMTLIYGAMMIAILFYIKSLGHLYFKPNFKAFTKERTKDMRSFGLYSILGSMGGVLATRIDLVMVGSLITLESVAIFDIATRIMGLIEIPQKSLTKISVPIIADSWKNNDLDHIKELYQKTSLNQFIFGFLFFLGVWLSIDELFQIIPKGEEFQKGKWVVFILGVSKVVDMLTGVNTEIIGLSKYFRFNFYAILSLAVFNVVTNLLLIPLYGMEGVAIATFASFFLFNMLKLGFLKYKLDMQPFTQNTLWVLLIGLFSFGIAYMIPDTSFHLLNIVFNSIVFCSLFVGGILYFKISEDIDKLVLTGVEKVKDMINLKK